MAQGCATRPWTRSLYGEPGVSPLFNFAACPIWDMLGRMPHYFRYFILLLGTLPLLSCSTGDVIRLAVSKDPSAALESMTRNRVASYQYNPVALVNDIKRARQEYHRLLGILSGEVGKEWGGGEVVTPGNKRYVKYTQNYKSRAIVEFDRGRVTVETLDTGNPALSLRSAIITTLLTPDDPRGVDMYSDRAVPLGGKPYLHGMVVDHRGRHIDTAARAEAYADHLLARQAQHRQIQVEGKRKPVLFVQIPMVANHQNIRAKQYEPLVDRYARQFEVSKSLIFAIMQTESSFNPYAVSTAPAYGLMQLVPSTAGRDAYSMVKGYDHTPSKEYLFIPDNNIELGTAYINILDRRYLAAISNPLSREYCVIAAYNGGAGSVLNMFSKNRQEAVRIINSLSPADVFARLRDEHPRDETRRYLIKVMDARRSFVTASR